MPHVQDWKGPKTPSSISYHHDRAQHKPGMSLAVAQVGLGRHLEAKLLQRGGHVLHVIAGVAQWLLPSIVGVADQQCHTPDGGGGLGMGWCVGQQCAQGYPQPPAEAWVDCQRTGRCAPDGLLRVGWALGKV